MFGLTFDKLLIIGVIAVFLLGPDKLPHYAAQLARLVRSLRDMARGAKDRMRTEMGSEFDDVDWKKLDPRQYDPRRIIKEALLDDDPEPVKPVSAKIPQDIPSPAESSPVVASTGIVTAATLRNPSVASHTVGWVERQQRIADGASDAPPYDAEAT